MVSYGPIGRTQSKSLFAAWGYQDAGQAQNECESAREFVNKVNAQIRSKLKKGYEVESIDHAMGWQPVEGHYLNMATACSLDDAPPVPRKPTKAAAQRAQALNAWLSKEDGLKGAVML